jgi:hypothetical protein
MRGLVKTLMSVLISHVPTGVTMNQVVSDVSVLMVMYCEMTNTHVRMSMNVSMVMKLKDVLRVASMCRVVSTARVTLDISSQQMDTSVKTLTNVWSIMEVVHIFVQTLMVVLNVLVRRDIIFLQTMVRHVFRWMAVQLTMVVAHISAMGIARESTVAAQMGTACQRPITRHVMM